jgi:hypothetical protein
MSREQERVVHMVAELLNVMFSMGAREIRSEIRESPDQFSVSVRGETRGDIHPKLKKMKKLLRMPRQVEMEEELWSLAGSVDYDTELSLVGMMTDEADVRYDGETGIVEIELVRKK